jgi:prepilin-type N-terminal cleavage/methylation domain-containing protein
MKKFVIIKLVRGFTLIELLIVVAIIAILAAIAVPNFLEAQNRTKVSATMADIRTLVLGVESYYIDWEQYPFGPDPVFSSTEFMNSHIPDTMELLRGYTPVSLTTPLAYLTRLPHDVFAYAEASTLPGPDGRRKINPLQLYHWTHKDAQPFAGRWHTERRTVESVAYVIVGVGPDGMTFINSRPTNFHNNILDFLCNRGGSGFLRGFYDSTNGTVSDGDILYHGPGMGFEPSQWVNID